MDIWRDLGIAVIGGIIGACVPEMFRAIRYGWKIHCERKEVLSIFGSCTDEQKSYLLWLSVKGVEVFAPFDMLDERFGSRMMANNIVECREIGQNKYFVMRESVRKILRENAKARLGADPDWRYRGSLIGSR